MAKNINMLTNQKETKRALKAAVDQSRKVLKKKQKNWDHSPFCALCGCIPKPDEWSAQVENCCFDCA